MTQFQSSPMNTMNIVVNAKPKVLKVFLGKTPSLGSVLSGSLIAYS
jgi:hypothetical protein